MVDRISVCVNMHDTFVPSAPLGQSNCSFCKVFGTAFVACAGIGGLIGACAVNEDTVRTNFLRC
eukprot:SAG25_NODE_52_length_18732_cov_99.030484_15_plen_64_part_00